PGRTRTAGDRSVVLVAVFLTTPAGGADSVSMRDVGPVAYARPVAVDDIPPLSMKSTVSEKGQVTIPKALRDRLGIRAGAVLDFEEEDGRLVAKKVNPVDPV